MIVLAVLAAECKRAPTNMAANASVRVPKMVNPSQTHLTQLRAIFDTCLNNVHSV